MNDEPSRFPLDWPPDWPRTPEVERKDQLQGGWQVTWNEVCHRLIGNLDKMGAEGIILSTNQPLRKTDGLPYANTGARIRDTAAAVYFRRQRLVRRLRRATRIGGVKPCATT